MGEALSIQSLLNPNSFSEVEAKPERTPAYPTLPRSTPRRMRLIVGTPEPGNLTE